MDNDVIVSLSFSSYSTNGSLASIAVKITKEFNQEAEDDDFEFSLVLDDQGQIHPDDFLDHKIGEKEKDEDYSVKISLSELFAYDREEYSSSWSMSSSEAEDDDDLEQATPERTYSCLWRPKQLVESNTKWKKSNSTGGERKSKGSWNKLCDLLRRSNSDGQHGPFISLNPNHNSEKAQVTEKVKDDDRKMKARAKLLASPSPSPSPLEVFYARNKAEKEGIKRKTYLPYRQQLVGLFSNVNQY